MYSAEAVGLIHRPKGWSPCTSPIRPGPPGRSVHWYASRQSGPRTSYSSAMGAGCMHRTINICAHSITPPNLSVALLVSLCDNPPCPVDGLEPMARDLAFLASALPRQSTSNRSSPLFGRLGQDTTVAGHSMGAAAALLAGDTAWSGAGSELRCGCLELPQRTHRGLHCRRIVALAPGLYPEQESCVPCHVKRVRDPTLLIAGDEDCVPESRRLYSTC